MHELSVIQSMMGIIERYANGREVEKVVVRVGKMSCIDAHFLKDSFDVFKEGTICENATIEILETDIKVKCFDCGKESKIEGKKFLCHFCGSYKVKVIGGNDVYIEYIEVKE